MSIFTGSIDERRNEVIKLLNIGVTFDIIQRNIKVAGRDIILVAVNGFLDSDLSEKIIEYFYSISDGSLPKDLQGFIQNCLPFASVTLVEDEQAFEDAVLSGLICFIIDGYDKILSIDTRQYPSRSIEEPDKDKVLRGSRDGFVESLLPNTALIRRRIRDENLIFEIQKVGEVHALMWQLAI